MYRGTNQQFEEAGETGCLKEFSKDHRTVPVEKREDQKSREREEGGRERERERERERSFQPLICC